MRQVILPSLLAIALIAGGQVSLGHADERSDETDAASTLGEVMARLRSDEPGVAAWGAHLAGRDGHSDALPLIYELLRNHVQERTKEWTHVHRAALDALIRLEDHPPPSLLALHSGRFPVQVLILRARDVETHSEPLLAHLDRVVQNEKQEQIGIFDTAVGNLLVEAREPGVAARLLGGLRFRLRVTVVTPESGSRGIGGGASVSGGSGDYWARVPDGFPPYAVYDLRTRAGPGHVLFAPGPRPVFFVRKQRANTGLLTGSSSRNWDLHESCLAWTADLLEVDAKTLALEERGYVSVEWTTPEAYVQRVATNREEFLTPYWALVRRMLAAKVVTPAEARNALPHLEVEISDRREEPREPLPELPAMQLPADLERD